VIRRLTLDFLKTEAAAGAMLAIAAALALLAANSPLAGAYQRLLSVQIPVQIGGLRHVADLATWVREGLMTLFFFVVGLDIKFEALRGELSNRRRLALPLLSALGGMAVPALVYMFVNLHPNGDLRGWSTPVATDIAFALAGLTAAGRGLAPSLRVFLLTLAIVDDLGAVLIIAMAYSHDLYLPALAGAGLTLAAMALLSRLRAAPIILYVIGLLIVWGFTLSSGVNTSIAGFAAAMTVPIEARRPGEEGVLRRVIEALHPWVAWLVLPLFAFTAAGLSFAPISLGRALSPITAGVTLALLVGKPLGVFGAAAAAIGLRLARRPSGASWLELFGVSILCGVGFTMSLFLSGLALPPDGPASGEAELGVLAGSLLSVGVGALVLRAAARARRASVESGATPAAALNAPRP
jgi:NhaA family Na+:H+ antiporter